ncbi:uncharacterized protein HLK63_A04059 [Nakaseomyces glabratus]|nr:uncharacterized protein GW608_A04059 [Nakaseomyces glabratus]UCS24136.1 uncharacterized protein HLK63_A04059 [Nakaseomyces glabratus]UCS29366.1 uncharacterized protein HLK64_A04059 [Nakaseomyces glabratus]UCS34595.1 uncharacterized protein HLK62_A04059 [Nakaseomyces glabratus]
MNRATRSRKPDQLLSQPQRYDYNTINDLGATHMTNGGTNVASITTNLSTNPNVEIHEEVFENNARKLGPLKIRYDSKKLLNFKRLLEVRSENAIKDSEASIREFDPNGDSDALQIPEVDDDIPYRGVVVGKKNYSTHRTIPSSTDREFFRRLFLESSTAAFYNGNVLLGNHDINDNDTSQPPNKKLKNVKAVKENPKTIEYVYIRDSEVKTWYTAPYPEEFNKNKILYVCEYCLKYMNSRFVYYRHTLKCKDHRPPGNEIYRDENVSVWEIDGRENVVYCQNLCLLAKLFLNSKTLYYDVEPFVFYVLTEREVSEDGTTVKNHFVGYFSKEKLNSSGYNLSCIITLPLYQRRGYGHFLMDFSYLLSKREFSQGTPEKPLSDLGLITYRNFWKLKCAETLLYLKNELNLEDSESDDKFPLVSIEDLANLTGMLPTDVILGLEELGVFYRCPDPNQNTTSYCIKIDSWNRIKAIRENWLRKGYQSLKPENLIWKPLIYGPSGGVNALGMVEPPSLPEDRKTSISSEPNFQNNPVDFFGSHITMVKKFMTDDIEDPRDLEILTIDNIKKRKLSVGKNNMLQQSWEISYQDPRPVDKKDTTARKAPSLLSSKTTRKESQMSAETEDVLPYENQEMDDTSVVLETEESDPDDNDYDEEDINEKVISSDSSSLVVSSEEENTDETIPVRRFPRRHASGLDDASDDDRDELIDLTTSRQKRQLRRM